MRNRGDSGQTNTRNSRGTAGIMAEASSTRQLSRTIRAQANPRKMPLPLHQRLLRIVSCACTDSQGIKDLPHHQDASSQTVHRCFRCEDRSNRCFAADLKGLVRAWRNPRKGRIGEIPRSLGERDRPEDCPACCSARYLQTSSPSARSSPSILLGIRTNHADGAKDR